MLTFLLLLKKDILKCLYDQIFDIPHFYIFVKGMTFLVNLPNFKSLRAWKVAFFDGFYTRLYAINQACSGSDVKHSNAKNHMDYHINI